MTPTAPQIVAALYGAFRLLRFDPDGLRAFDVGPTAFWQSFFAAFIAAPGYAILIALHMESAPSADVVSTGLLHGFAYVISWTAFPLVVFYLAQAMDRAEHWVGFVIAFNWSKVVQMAIYLPLVLASASGVFGDTGGNFLTLVGLIAVLVYQWYVTRSALDIPGPAAAGLTVVDLILGMFITSITDAALAS
jgi:hypothetical protein